MDRATAIFDFDHFFNLMITNKCEIDFMTFFSLQIVKRIKLRLVIYFGKYMFLQTSRDQIF